ncbi:hypothetical protein BH09MYX1_BH09MYX1_09880 [soil metagenome]
MALIAGSLLTAACGTKSTQRVGETPVAASALSYRFESLDARPVTSEAFAGKFTVMVFIATGDLVSQAQANFLVAMASHDGDRVNYALVALQDGTTRELVEGYRDALKITFPIALGDTATTAGGGPFGDVATVPTVVVIDPEGRLKWKKTGLAKPDEIRAQMVVPDPAATK